MFTRILVPLDGSDLAEEALGMAAAIARASGAAIDLLMVHEPLFPEAGDPAWNEREIVAAQKYLHQIADELSTGAGVTSNQTLLRGRPDELIAVRAADCGADLIVMTSHGRTGWARAWMGSVADSVMRSSNLPVLMLRPAEQRRDRRALHRAVQRILVPLDGSPESFEIAGPVASLARCWRARVDLLRVVAPVPIITSDIAFPIVYLPNVTDSEATEGLVTQANAQLERDAEKLQRDGIKVGERSVVVSPSTAKAIADYARGRGTDVIAMATHGRGQSRLLIGSVAEKVRHASDLPVLMYRPVFAQRPLPQLTTTGIVEQPRALAGAGAGK